MKKEKWSIVHYVISLTVSEYECEVDEMSDFFSKHWHKTYRKQEN